MSSQMNADRMKQRRKTVLVTGASGGIGRAICLGFAGAGWKVGVHYFNNAEGAATTVSLMSERVRGQEADGESKIYRADITLRSEVHDLVQNFVEILVAWTRWYATPALRGRTCDQAASGGLGARDRD